MALTVKIVMVMGGGGNMALCTGYLTNPMRMKFKSINGHQSLLVRFSYVLTPICSSTNNTDDKTGRGQKAAKANPPYLLIPADCASKDYIA